MKDGKRVLDENGFWKNEVLPPVRQNKVTALYDQLGLAGSLHNASGARIADALLTERGFPADFRARVAEVIAAHLKPEDAAGAESGSLYDADTIDANIGLPAFYRNIQISLHFQERQYVQRGESLDDYLTSQLAEYLDPYLREKIPGWIDGKHNDFVAKLTTQSGKQIARARIDRLRSAIGAAADELSDYPTNSEVGRLGVVRRFMLTRRNPALSSELAYLSNHWQHEGARLPSAAEFVALFRDECAGKY